ncbi:MAG: peptidoglycan DD-metalloendopeptidase family protein [Oscillospiraceae bacterium]|nr:peptidoglycan DD-metalloendopeptidase family protein [Oscillospiraceae bacterium]
MLHKKFLLPIICCAVLIILFAFTLTPAQAASSSEIRDQIDAMEQEQENLREEMAKLEGQIQQNSEDIKTLVANKSALDQQINVLHKQISVSNDQIAAYALLIADKQLELEKAEQYLAELNVAYKARIRAMEEEGSLSFWQVLFESRSLSDFLDRLNIIEEIARADNKRLKQLQFTADLVAQAKEDLLTEKQALEAARLQLNRDQQTLEAKSEQATAVVADLLAKGIEYELLLDKAEEDEQKLLDEIAKLEDDFDDAVYQEWLATYVPPTTAPETPPVSDSGWLTPVTNYRLSSPFGMRPHPILGYERMHNGIDMACPAWTPIYATRGGKVTIAKYSDSAGNYVQINHGDGYSSVYMHMIQYVVSYGDYVAQGQLIGYVGNTGLSKGNHLHFGISYNGTYVNPMEYIG